MENKNKIKVTAANPNSVNTSVTRAIPTISYTYNPYGQNKLCATAGVEYELPVKYSYTVYGRTPDADFTYSNIDAEDSGYIQNPNIPIIGLYANRDTFLEITLLDSEGNRFQGQVTFTEWQNTDFGDATILAIDYDIYDQDMFDRTFGNGWLINNLYNAYDKNGDLRMTGLYPWNNSPMKTHNGSMYCGDHQIANIEAQALYKTNPLGSVKVQYQIPQEYYFSHDFTWDNSGYLYAITTPAAPASDEQKSGSTIIKFDDASGELVWLRDYSRDFDGQYILENSATNDVHFNSLDYIEKFNIIVVNVRSCSLIFAIDADNGDIVWSVDNPASPVTFRPDLALTVLNPDNFRYGNGEHTVFHTSNAAYAAYQTATRFPITIFNNNSCMDAERRDLERIMEAPATGDFERIPTPVDAIVYGIDMEANTVEMLNLLTFENDYTEFASSVFETGDDYCMCIRDERCMYVYDVQNHIGARANNIIKENPTYEEGILYRARIFSYEELSSLIDNAFN